MKGLKRGRWISPFSLRMRDNHEGMPEIVAAFEKDGQYFGIVGIQVSSESRQFQFGVSANGYRALRKILQLRPFDTMPGVKQRYEMIVML